MDAKVTNAARSSAMPVPLTGGGRVDVQPGQTRYVEGIDDTDEAFLQDVEEGLLLVEKKGVEFTIGAESGGNVILVTLQFLDEAMRSAAPGTKVGAICYLSDDASGAGETASAATSLASATGSVTELVTGKVFLATTDAAGLLEVEIEKAGAKTYYLVVVLDGRLYVSDAITFAA